MPPADVPGGVFAADVSGPPGNHRCSIGPCINSLNFAIIVDEIQYLDEKEVGALIMAIHRVNQRGRPIVMVAAGLPQILGKTRESKSYAERLFDEALSKKDAISAVADPARDADVEFSLPALEEIDSVPSGYPCFLQEWSYVAWNMATKSPIDLETIKLASPEAMGHLGHGPHPSGDIAKAYNA